MNINLLQQHAPQTKTFEITLCLRDSQGEPTNRTKSYASDDAYKIWQFYMNNKGRPKRKNRKPNPNNLPTATQAEKILANMYKDDQNDDGDIE